MAKKKGEAAPPSAPEPEETPSVIAQLRDEIRASGQSLNKLGQTSGVSAGQLSRFLRGERKLTSEAIDRICRALNLELRRRRKPAAEREE